jgi:hypothetical protein
MTLLQKYDRKKADVADLERDISKMQSEISTLESTPYENSEMYKKNILLDSMKNDVYILQLLLRQAKKDVPSRISYSIAKIIGGKKKKPKRTSRSRKRLTVKKRKPRSRKKSSLSTKKGKSRLRKRTIVKRKSRR